MRLALIALFAVAIWWGVDDWQRREIDRPPGVLVSAEPTQRDIAATGPIRVGKYTLTPRAEFGVTARVLSSERYRFDSMADLIPRDIALGWGPMSDSSLIANIDISQSGRFYFWRPRETQSHAPMASLEMIAASSANMHLIPANANVARLIDRARVGHIIELHGQLVDVRADNGWQINTSLSRNDTGAGACEIIYVERATKR